MSGLLNCAKNNPVINIDPDGRITFSALLLKAGAKGGTTDLLAQLSYFFNPEIKTIDDAIGQVNWWRIARAAGNFAIGYIGDVGGENLGDLINKYGSDVVERGLKKIGFSDDFIDNAW